jgi:hypothetical protein
MEIQQTIAIWDAQAQIRLCCWPLISAQPARWCARAALLRGGVEPVGIPGHAIKNEHFAIEWPAIRPAVTRLRAAQSDGRALIDNSDFGRLFSKDAAQDACKFFIGRTTGGLLAPNDANGPKWDG